MSEKKEWYLARHDGVIEYIDPDSVSRFLYDTYWAVITEDPISYSDWEKEVDNHVVGYRYYHKLPIHTKDMQELLYGLGYAVNTLLRWDRRAAFKLMLDWLFLAAFYVDRAPDAIYVMKGEKNGYRYVAVYFDYEFGEKLKEHIERKIEDIEHGKKRANTQQ